MKRAHMLISRRDPKGRPVLLLGICGALAACVTPGTHLSTAPLPLAAQERPANAGNRSSSLDTRRDGSNAPATASTHYVDVGDAWLRVRDQGPRSHEVLPVVLVHGYGSRLEIWDEIQSEIATSRRVIAYDQRGFGLSERPAGAYGPLPHARDLIAVLDHLQIARAIVVGHSYGGGVAVRSALYAPQRIAGLGLIDAFLLDEQVPRSFRWAQIPILGELLFGAFYQEVPGEKYLLAFHDQERFVSVAALEEQRELMAKPGSVYAALETVRGMDYDKIETHYEQVDVPMLIVWGEEDRVTPLQAGKRLAARLDGASFVVLAGSGHVPSWERPRGLLRVLQPFFAEAEAKVPSPPGAAPGRVPNAKGPADASIRVAPKSPGERQ